jgi:hypothetical protein
VIGYPVKNEFEACVINYLNFSNFSIDQAH